MCKGLLAIYNRQTAEEKSVGDTVEENGIGFTGADGEILSSLAEQYRSRGSLSVKQMAILKKKMPKYWRQIAGISNREKLLGQVKRHKETPLRG
jgi:hypothetical protein